MIFRPRSGRVLRSGFVLCLLNIVCVLSGGIVAIAKEPPTAPGFRDRTTDLGLQLAGSQACWVDVDNDGWTDLCAVGDRP